MNIIYIVLVYSVWFLSMYFLILFILFLIDNRKKLFNSPKLDPDEPLPKVSIVISAFNEEKKIGCTIECLGKIDYPKDQLEIIIVNDGSTDNTRKAVRSYMKDNNFIFIDNKINKGKAACLNQGIKAATGKYVACMDADSVVARDALKKTIPYFKEEKVGAVSIAVEVKNPKNLIEKLTEIEYILGLSLFLRVLSYLNSIHVTPGPFSIYRKDMLDKIGGFDENNITEDLEIAYRIRKAGYEIDFCMDTHVETVIPRNFKSLYRQRRRWYSGALYTLWKHKDMALNSRYGIFGYFLVYNYALTFLGLLLFIFTSYLIVKNLIDLMYFYYLIDFNFLENLSFEIDFLSVSIFQFFSMSAFMITIIILISGMLMSKKSIRNRKVGIVGYFYIFFMYEVFWMSSILHVLLNRRVKWR